jgi:5'-phosphate synthase pdxT subunit
MSWMQKNHGDREDWFVYRKTMKIGVLALQGDFAEHINMLRRLKVETAEVRLPEHLTGLDGLIIPGGESTTIGKLAVAYDLMEPLQSFGRQRAV